MSLIWIILHCYYADLTTDRMERVKYTTYDSKWFELPVELQRLSTLIILRSQALLRFNGWSIVYCTLETLGKVWYKSKYSFSIDSFRIAFLTPSIFRFANQQFRIIWYLEDWLKISYWNIKIFQNSWTYSDWKCAVLRLFSYLFYY